MSVYCETGIGVLLTQPVNTISNVALLIFAFFAYRLVASHKIQSKTIRSLPMILAAIGLGSLAWHAAPHPFTNFLDTFSIAIFVFILFYLLMQKFLKKRLVLWGVLLTVVSFEGLFIFDVLPSQNGFNSYLLLLIFGLLVFLGIAMKYTNVIKQLLAISLVFVVAFFARSIDLTVCSTFSTGTHFLWQILSGLTLYLLIRLAVEVERADEATDILGHKPSK